MLESSFDNNSNRNRQGKRRIENDSPPEIESHRAKRKLEKKTASENKQNNASCQIVTHLRNNDRHSVLKNNATGEINLDYEKDVKSLANSSLDNKIETIKLWCSKPKVFIEEQIKIVHQHISMELPFAGNLAENKVITSCVEVLCILFFANLHKIYNGIKTSRSLIMHALKDSTLHLLSVLIKKCTLVTQPKIPFSKFIHKELSEKIDIVEEYCNAVKPKESQIFSFISYPFILTAQKKMEAYQHDRRIMLEIKKIMEKSDPEPLQLIVERENIIESISETFREVEHSNEKHFAKNIEVIFIGEEGKDEGGLKIDFIQSAVQEMLEKKLKDSFVLANDMRWFDALGKADLGMMKMLGILLGMALNNGVNVDLRFPTVFYKKLFGMSATSEDLAQLKPDLYKNLINSKEKDINELGLTFVAHWLGKTEYEYPLKKNGDTINVTHQTKDEYLQLNSNFLLNTSINNMFEALKTGFLMSAHRYYVWLNSESLEFALCGRGEIDLEELENSATYEGFERTSVTVRHLWKIVHQFTRKQKILFLKFFSARERVPIEGLSSLEMKIQRNGQDSKLLPSAQTCTNTLLIPNYKNENKLKHKLKFAIAESIGFFNV